MYSKDVDLFSLWNVTGTLEVRTVYLRKVSVLRDVSYLLGICYCITIRKKLFNIRIWWHKACELSITWGAPCYHMQA